jgi:hypothetical protein
MDKQATQQLAEPVIDSAILMASGAAKQIRRAAGGAVGGVVGIATAAIANELADRRSANDPIDSDYSGGGFLALTATRLALFATEKGRFKDKLADPLASFGPGELDRMEFGTAAAGVGRVSLVSTTGQRWTFEFSKLMKKKLVRMATSVNATVHDE